MKKRIVSLILCAIMLLPTLMLRTSAASTNASKAAGYLKKGDYIVVSPAEKWKDGKRVAVDTTEWELTAQHSGTANGNDIQTWKYGVSDKFYIENEETKSNGTSYVRIQCKDFRESAGGRYWDIEGRSKKTGGNVHVWDYKKSASQWFYLEEDGDGDPETFFLKNMNSNLYIVPRNYFKDSKSNCGQKRNSWLEEGCNLEQSNYAFRWRIQVLNRDAANDMGKTDKYANWMGLLPDSRLLSELNIPGTHDSGTANVEGSWNSSFNIVSCQKYFIEQQLYAGARSLDIRTAWNNDSKDMVLVHGQDYMVCHTPNHGNKATNKTFRSTLDTVIKYLKTHKTETVIMTLKIDAGDVNKGTAALRNILSSYIKRGSDTIHYFYDWTQGRQMDDPTFDGAQKWLTSPTLGDVRGKIVLMSRVDFENGQKSVIYRFTGPNLTKWDESYNDEGLYAQKIISDSNVGVFIQDDYECPDGNKKTAVYLTIQQLNNKVSYKNWIAKNEFIFNYTSKTTSDSLGASPLGGAKYMNNVLFNYDLYTPGTDEAKDCPRIGIIVMDYVNKQLCRRIIDRNTFPSSAGMKFGSLAVANASTNEKSSVTPLLSKTATQTMSAEISVEQNEIVWPKSAELTYGYVLSEASLNFADDASEGREGYFKFVNADEIIPATEAIENGTVKDYPVKRALKFVPTDGSEEVTKEIPITVHRRPLPVKIGNYEVAYGDEFKRSDLSVTAGGYLLEKDLESLNDTLQKYKIKWVLWDSDGKEIEWPGVPATDTLSSGTIGVRAGVSINPEIEFPNYQASVELGSWEVVPRTVTVSWYKCGDSFHAKLGNVLDGDEVEPSIADDGTLTLTGAKADCYQIADEDQTPPENAQPTDTELKNPKAATCLKDGYTGDEVCKICGKVVKKGNIISATGHNFKNGKCITCGATDDNRKQGQQLPISPNTDDSRPLALYILAAAAFLPAVILLISKKKRINEAK